MKTNSCFWTLIFILSFPGVGIAQMGSMQGTVTDSNGNPIKGAVVAIESPETGRKYKLKTNKKGKYMHVAVVYTGTYAIVVTKEGYSRQYLEGARASLSQGNDEQGIYHFVLTDGDASDKLDHELTDEDRERMSKALSEQLEEEARQAEITEKFEEGQFQLSQGLYKEAIQSFERAIELDEKQPAVLVALGQARQKLGQTQKTLEAYQKAVMINPDAAVYQTIGNLYSELKEPEKAKESYQKAIELSAGVAPTVMASTFYNMAVGHMNAANSREAKKALESALKSDPNHAEAHYQMGIVLSQRRTTIPQGLEHLKKYIELAPEGPNAEMAKLLIEALG